MVTTLTSAMRSPRSVIEGRQRLAEVRQQIRELPDGRLRADLVDVMIPAADIGERHFQTDIGFDQPRDLHQVLAQLAGRIVRVAGGRVGLLLDRLQRFTASKVSRPVPFRTLIVGARVHALEGRGAARYRAP